MDDDDEPRPAPPTDRDSRVALAGAAAIASGLLVLVSLTGPRITALNAIGILGVLVSPAPILGLLLAGAGRSSRLGLRALTTWLGAYGLFILALLLAAVLSAISKSLTALAVYLALPAALALVLAGPVAAALIGVARELAGWRRWIPVGLAFSMSLAVLPGLGVRLPSSLLILLLPLFLILTGAALLTLEKRVPQPEPAPA